jgi:hypothetical protein
MKIENLIAKARLLDCVKFIRQSIHSWCFYDEEGWLRLHDKIDSEAWMPKPYSQGSLTELRKTYERYTRTRKGKT